MADEELEAGEAANFIISQMKAFKLEASDAEHIIDAVYLKKNWRHLKHRVNCGDIFNISYQLMMVTYIGA